MYIQVIRYPFTTNTSINDCPQKIQVQKKKKKKMLIIPSINSLNAKVVIIWKQPIDLHSRSVGWFLYDDNFGV